MAEFGHPLLGLLAGGVEAPDGAAATAGASEHVSAEGALMKLGPVQLGWGDVGLKFNVVTKTKLPAVQVEDLRRDDNDIEDFLRTAVGVLAAVDAGISFPIRGWACRGCQFKARCKAAGASR